MAYSSSQASRSPVPKSTLTHKLSLTSQTLSGAAKSLISLLVYMVNYIGDF